METRIYDYEYTYSYDLATYVQYDRIPSTKVLSYEGRSILSTRTCSVATS